MRPSKPSPSKPSGLRREIVQPTNEAREKGGLFRSMRKLWLVILLVGGALIWHLTIGPPDVTKGTTPSSGDKRSDMDSSGSGDVVSSTKEFTSTSTKTQEDEHTTVKTTTELTTRTVVKKKPARKRTSSSKVDRIAILGERNTGTRWITDELIRCFPQMKVQSRLLRWKHWFQDDDNQEHFTTLVLAQFRDPYEWAEAMRHVAHHSPNHLYYNGDFNGEWEEFITKPWTMGQRPLRDLAIKNKDAPNICYEHFNYNELESCIEGGNDDPEYKAMFDTKTGLNKNGFPIDDPHDFSANKPIYELKRDGSGKPFANMMDMRSAKIYNHLATNDWNWVKETVAVQYEKLLWEGTEDLIARFEKITNLTRQCTPSQPQKRPKRLIDPRFINWITDNIDWDAEALLGYEKRPYQTEEDIQKYDKLIREDGDHKYVTEAKEETEEEEQDESAKEDDKEVSSNIASKKNLRA
eukprot:CAMPEP_0198282728 /NCGR_PEP_ID=MMETSP1449-20131203/2497_1 /TAXON_ID=420275 /ORGANISM="Attheya septentrionalis, Strain CCMP2084" /LENGTH=464 /DNA_ID=CAMNT_0043979103 /DNA_START=205 /DNA_END=1599 /DNA_ORIENTATION=-